MRIRLVLAVFVAAALAAVGFVSPAQAAQAPKPGSGCMMSGDSRIVDGRAYFCERDDDGNTWSRGVKLKASELTIDDQWVKAAKSGMTAGFGIISNPTAKPITIIGARSPRYAGLIQLHEVAMNDGSMQMMEKDGGITVPAGGSVTLEPGADHLMFMRMKQPIDAGDMVPILLITSDGGTLRFKAMGKVYAGANEDYNDMGNGGMDMSG